MHTGLASAEDNIESSMVLRVLKCLASKDKLVSDVAWDQLRATIKKRTGQAPENSDDIINFLNTPPTGNEVAMGARDIRLLWSMVRKALQFLDVKLKYKDDQFTIVWQEKELRTTRWKAVSDLLKTTKEER